MAHLLLFHHARGRTAGCEAFAARLRAAGHEVDLPDLFNGRTFDTTEAGVAYAEELGFAAIIEQGVQIAAALPAELVYGGFSLGSLPAQELVQNRPGARGALLFHGGAPVSSFGSGWPEGVPVQVHTMDRDPWQPLEETIAFIDSVDPAELFVYRGDRHLFADESTDDYDHDAAQLLEQRVLEFLASVDAAHRGDAAPSRSPASPA